ncbi:hypothetical protein D770_20295 [Flammeovirgaceae bacterium 311]|nr:hypothetical protein D770_20295 [Flammeovirgaceae bacterium 311]
MKNEEAIREVYLNPKQLAFIKSPAKNKDIIGGRGSGKTGLIGVHNFQKFRFLPGARSGLAALTFGQLLNNTLPSMEELWKAHGLKEHTDHEPGHYVVGKRPPEHWMKCNNRPKKFDTTITFINGYTIQMISVDRIDTVRGLSLDALDVDEKGWVKQEDYDKVLAPLVRANKYRSYSGHYLHKSKCGFSSMPWLAKQHWILRAEELAVKDPEKYFYIEATAEDNIKVLGEEYLEEARMSLPNIIFMVEYMNMRPKRVSNAFYPAFDDEKHCDAFTYTYDKSDAGLWLAKDSDVQRNKPLELSWDFNVAFTSLLVCQEHIYSGYRELRVCNELYIEEAKGNLVEDLCYKFIDEYRNHPNRDIFIHGDRNGNSKNAGSNETFYEQITRILSAAGFNVYNQVEGLDGALKKRYFLINRILGEQEKGMPRVRINQNKCKFLPISIQMAGMVGDFQKDKRSEKGSGDQKKATHLSDCFDNILWRKYSNYMGVEIERWEAGVC